MAPGLLVDDGNVLSDSNITEKAVSRSSLLHRSLHADPLRVVGASGNYIHLDNGQMILDSTGGAAVSCIGHGNEKVKAAIMEQMDEISYCHSLFFSTSAAEDLATELIDSAGGKMSKAFIISSGKGSLHTFKMTCGSHIR